MRSLNIFKNSGKIHRAFIYYGEHVIKFAGHLQNLLFGNISAFALLHFRALFNYLILLKHLNLAKIILVVLGTSWTNMLSCFAICSPFTSSHLSPILWPFIISCEAILNE